MRSRLVAVVGSGSCAPSEYETAVTVGRLLAENGLAVLCGGLGGVMEGACKGVTQAGGFAIGLLPGADPRDANPYVGISIPTGHGEGRNLLVVRASEAVIAIGGEYGTLSEIALALKLGKPTIGLDTWQLSKAGQVDSGILCAQSPEEAVRLCIERIGDPP